MKFDILSWKFTKKKKKKEIFKQRRLKLKNLNVIITSTFFLTGIYILVTNQYNTDNMNSQLKSILQEKRTEKI